MTDALHERPVGPTATRMVLGVMLRRLREARNISLERAGEAIRASHATIRQLELGRTGFRLRDVVDLYDLYGVTDHAERATLLGLARQANARGWWHAYDDVVPHWFEAYLGLEQAAGVIRTYEVQFVPGLLQTTEYARAVIRLGHHHRPEPEVERRLALRMHRQDILRRPRPPYLWVVIDEAALRRPIGGAAVMFAQLQRLIDLSELPHVTIQLLPFNAAGHAAAGGPITLLRLPEPELPDVVYLEQLSSAVYPDRNGDPDYYRDIMNRLATQAERPSATPGILRRIIREL
ncbi:helix-turn-helix transcriptional regulator [Actinomadura sp. DC4]|uniref:helix-turn-helix domain-containing protein n=1 Tax=Actinomadura sp. DC4 TaxID=3055069 RepID=UPI0025B22700|nr:helix-turn-helix transcriptional regulator [Actinomadura sp. DC4]MDN3353045.1 helix-turn-helix transcriptional regulator [Actinomadura sp. DC4]